MKVFPHFEVENLGDDDANLWLVKASRNSLFGIGSSRDNVKARELALQSLEAKEAQRLTSSGSRVL